MYQNTPNFMPHQYFKNRFVFMPIFIKNFENSSFFVEVVTELVSNLGQSY